jgi:hypothetical protein
VLRYISENSAYDYGERLKEKLVDDDPKYMELRLNKLEIDEVLEIAKSICRQFEARGYSLKNITNLVVAEAQDDTLMLNVDE